MSLRVYVHMDNLSGSMRYIATAVRDGKSLFTLYEYGGPEVVKRLVSTMSSLLERNGYKAPHDYWLENFRRDVSGRNATRPALAEPSMPCDEFEERTER